MAGALALLAIAAGAYFLLEGGSGGDKPPQISNSGVVDDSALRARIANFEPFAYDESRDENFMERGSLGLSHPIYANSPGGVVASAERTDEWRDEIEAAAADHDVDPDTLEALVFLESAGRPDVIAGKTPDAAVGLGQILPGTATDLLGMNVDLARSIDLTKRIARDTRRAEKAKTAKRRRAAARRIPKLEAERRAIDERFDPERSLDGAARYLALAEKRFGREDLAVTSYHMGIGNLEQVIDAYVSPKKPARTTAQTVERYGITYPKLYFDSSPLRNPKTFRKLNGFADDSRHYPFRHDASRRILEEWREDPDALQQEAEDYTRKASAEEVLRPEDDNPPFEDADALNDAYEDRDLLRVPDEPRALGFKIDKGLGELARRLKVDKRLYRGLRPDALATLIYLSKEVRRISGVERPVVFTSGVRDLPYQEKLLGVNSQATSGFSIHTTGHAFDLLRPRSDAQHRAIEQVLERLRALRVVDWVYEPSAFHVTVGEDGEAFRPLLEAVANG